MATLNGKRINRPNGFSLVEVAMSLAIVGFACVAMLGMIPMGLTQFHKAMGNTIEADVVQNLTNDILLANFSNVWQYNNQVYYYDNEGTPLGSSAVGGTVPDKTVYKATVTMKGVDSATVGTSSYAPVALVNNGVATNNSGVNTSAYNVAISIISTSNINQPDLYSVIVPNNNL